MSDEYLRLKSKNSKLKQQIWNDYRKYTSELKLIKNQNRNLENSILIEQNKNRDLIQQFSNRINKLQEQLREANYNANNLNFESRFSTLPKSRPYSKKDDYQWRFMELEEEGNLLQAETEKIFKRCRESSLNQYWRNDTHPPISSYNYEFSPIVINPPEMGNNIFGTSNYRYNNSDLDDSSSMNDDLHMSPINSAKRRLYIESAIQNNESDSDYIYNHSPPSPSNAKYNVDNGSPPSNKAYGNNQNNNEKKSNNFKGDDSQTNENLQSQTLEIKVTDSNKLPTPKSILSNETDPKDKINNATSSSKFTANEVTFNPQSSSQTEPQNPISQPYFMSQGNWSDDDSDTDPVIIDQSILDEVENEEEGK